jgi:hypothetical protein
MGRKAGNILLRSLELLRMDNLGAWREEGKLVNCYLESGGSIGPAGPIAVMSTARWPVNRVNIHPV